MEFIESFEEGRLFGADLVQALGAVPNEYLHYYYYSRDDLAADPFLASRHFVAYAWPRERAITGDLVFAINQFEEVFTSDNLGASQRYDGPEHMPNWDAALSGSEFGAGFSEGLGQDGGIWVRWRNKGPKPLDPAPQ